MAYQLLRSEEPGQGIRRIIGERIDAAVRELTGGNPIHRQAHETRKRLKEIRAALRLVRGGLNGLFSMENTAFRDAGRELAPLREAQAMVEAIDKLKLHYRGDPAVKDLRRVKRDLQKRRDRVIGGMSDVPDRVRRSTEGLRQARHRVPAWPLEKESLALIRPGLRETFRKGRKAFARAEKDRSAENFHEWRKRVKDLWYQAQLLRNVHRKFDEEYRKRVETLSQLLGEHHDLDALRAVVAEEPIVVALIDRRLREIEPQSFTLGRLLYR